ncbi:MAG: DUF935 domain-containing protein [Deferribacteraceae bacterium]|jgi:phage gp29-like protein|nr:DUF935 domain-containing protein [Deferribacteraceae bacterium]
MSKKNKKQAKINAKQLETPDYTDGIVILKDREYPSAGLTPSKLADALKSADKGNISAQSEMFAEMLEKDWDLASAFSSRAAKVAGLEYNLTPGDDSAPAKKAAEVAEVMLDEYLVNLRAGLKWLLSAVGHGFAVSEINWEQVDGNLIMPTELIPVEHRFFTFLYDKKLNRIPRMLTENNKEEGEELLPFKYIVHKYTGMSGVTPRDGLVRQCAYIYLFKNFGMKDWNSFLDRYGIPIRIGKYSPAATKGALDVLKRAVISLGADAAALISDATTIEILETKGASTNMFERLQDHLAGKIDKVVLGHQAAAIATPGKLGSDDQIKNIAQLLKESDAHELEQTIRQQLLYPFVLLNFGEACPVPIFRFNVAPAEDKEREAKIISTLTGAGLKIPTAFLYNKFNIPQPKEGEETLESQAHPVRLTNAHPWAAASMPHPEGSLRSRAIHGADSCATRDPVRLTNAHPWAGLADGNIAPQTIPPSAVHCRPQDTLTDLLPTMTINDAFDEDMKIILKIIKNVNTYAELEEILSKIFKSWTDTKLKEEIAKGLYLAEIAGLSEDITR